MRTLNKIYAVIAAGAAVLCCTETSAKAGPHDFVIYVTRLGGDPESAQPYIDKFVTYLQAEVGWPKGSAKGAFVDSKKEALAFINQQKPGLGVIEPALYLELRKEQGLEPVAQVLSADLVTEKLHLLVKDPAVRAPMDLSGKTISTLLSDFPEYLSRIVFAGKMPFAFKHVGQAMKGVRAVLRDESDGTLLDDGQMEAAKKLEGGAALHSVYDASSLPPLPVVAFGKVLKPDERKKLVKVLLDMCGTPKGGEVCKDMHIRKFAPVNTAAFVEAQRRYDQAPRSNNREAPRSNNQP